ncbi:hypothetical protein IC229_11525 [Spirosoma sp. BT702]|uniref:Uncharacterized protein n=1 Tax=Spirosoma profusum TaxID=2771354 RepID=A0A926Y2V1_9BACT|nr:hypothetical protein [Spirosoma profusum]MBD2701270.1 hypothetical protein [Spirosoma profusum]
MTIFCINCYVVSEKPTLRPHYVSGKPTLTTSTDLLAEPGIVQHKVPIFSNNPVYGINFGAYCQ